MSQVEQFLTTVKEQERTAALDKLKAYFPEIFSSGPNTLNSVLTDPTNNLRVADKREWHVKDKLRLVGNSDQFGLRDFTFRFFEYPKDGVEWGIGLELHNLGGINLRWEGDQYGSKNSIYISAQMSDMYFDPGANSLEIQTPIGRHELPLDHGFTRGRIREFDSSRYWLPIDDASSIGNLLNLSFKNKTILNSGILALPIKINPTKFE